MQFWKCKNMFVLSVIFQHWHGEVLENIPHKQQGTANTIATDDLVTKGARPSAAMIFS